MHSFFKERAAAWERLRTENPSDPRILERTLFHHADKEYFPPEMRKAGAEPLLWTTGFMSPEVYTLEAALSGWVAGDSAEAIEEKAAMAYDNYQDCGLKGARVLFESGF